MKKLLKKFKKTPKVAVLRLDGVIGGGSRFGGPSLSDAELAPLLERAFRKGKPDAVALAINSPGGSPVQSSLIGARIRRLSIETKTPVFAFCEDVAASGGYWLACSADEIFVDESSIVGSIGVISASFGFQDLLQKQGIERRVHTAGKDKSMGDPFRPEKPEDIERIKALQKTIHDNFIAHVKTRRGEKLAQTDLFTGEIWVGASAVDLGLVDSVGHLVPMMKFRYGEDVKFIFHGKKKSLLSKFGLTAASNIASSIEDRALWSKFGL
ncbi:multidrug transporter [Amylibacter ulvae]|uniref:Multidrug transporter n=1 Tax=Paramylibacter ulvae TaxID=1651968 RepID=A0ABQ3D508_9RHOB|nr:S49 family peptidase [Amylibacter ulvae]GHA58105.1 multidrug transporter [Amylibacter ulvae]